MKLTDHCYCIRGLTHSDYFSVNAGFIVGKSETIIIDSGFNIESAQTIFHYAQAVAPNNRISTLINLEGHFDHIFGNGYFTDKGIKIVAHQNVGLTEAEIHKYIAEANNEIKFESRRQNNEAYIYFKGVQAFKPSTKISKDREMKLDGLTIKIVLAPGHTETNLMVYVEKDKIIYAGDTIYAEYLPTLKFGNEELWNKWIETLKIIEDLKPDILVPGHGKVLKKQEIQIELDRHMKILNSRLS